MKAGAYFHARFENILPFADGNGRVGRALLNYWLMVNDYPLTIIYEENKRAYYEALQECDEQESQGRESRTPAQKEYDRTYNRSKVRKRRGKICKDEWNAAAAKAQELVSQSER